MNKGQTVLRDPDLRRLRALMMVEMKVKTGATHAEIAKEFGVSEITVARTFTYVKKAKLLAGVEDRIISELLPAAHTAIATALADTDKPQEAGKLGLDLMKTLLPSMKKTPTSAADAGGELARYIDQPRNEAGPDGDDVIDGTVEGDTLPALPPAETPASPEGIPEPSRGIPTGPSLGTQVPSSLGELLIEAGIADSEGSLT